MKPVFAKLMALSRRTSLKVKIATLIAGLVLCLTAGFVIFLLHQLESQLKLNIHRQQFALVTSMAGHIDDKLSMAQQSLLGMSRHFPPLLLSGAAAQNILDLHDDQLVIFDQGVYLINLKGELVAESPARLDRQEKNFADRAYFQQTLASEQPVISDPFLSRTKNQVAMIMFTVPLRDDTGDMIAVLGGAMSLTGTSFLARIGSTRIGENGYVYLYNDQRTMIQHPDVSRILQQDVPPGANRLFDRAIEGFEGTGITVNSRGLEVLASFKRLKTTNWIMAANYPVAEAYASIRQAERLVIGSLVPLGALILVGSLLIIHRLLRPLSQLTSQVRALTLAPGDGQPELWENELTVLGDAFQAFVAQQAADRASLLAENHRAEAARVKTEAIIAAIGDGLNIIAPDFRLLYLNHTSLARLGDIVGELCYQAIHQRDVPCPDCPLLATLHDGEVHTVEQNLRCNDELRHFELTVAPLRDPEGRIVAGIELVRDISERRRADERVRILSAAVEQCPALIMITDPCGRIEYINPRYVQTSGFAPEELCGRHASELGDQESTARQTMWGEIISGAEWKGEFRNRKKNGEWFWEAAAIAPVKSRDGRVTHFVKVSEDMTERRTLELQLRHAQKMEAIGQLAAGVAHDFNNLLTAIIGYASIQQFKAAEGSTLKADLAGILTAAGRGTKLTRDLLAFSRKGHPEQGNGPLQSLELNDLVRRGSELLQRILGETIDLIVRLAPEPLWLSGNDQHLEQALLNLGANARDAMPGGGRLCLQTESIRLDQRFVARHGYGTPGRYAVLTLADTGSGMDQETIKRVFDPFFTTKSPDKGTGLGLSISYGIIKQHQGYITCHSLPGQGTTFRIFLPLPETDHQSPPPEPTAAGRETILLAEADETARILTRTLLEESGYLVMEAGGGQEALQLFATQRKAIDGLILDPALETGTGIDLAGAILSLAPEARMVCCCDLAAESSSQQGLLAAGAPLLVKPTPPHQLLAKLREVLNR